MVQFAVKAFHRAAGEQRVNVKVRYWFETEDVLG